MATRAELLREIKRLRNVAESQFSRIDKAIQSGRLPKSAKGTYFYDIVEYQRRPENRKTSALYGRTSGKVDGKTIKKADLEKMVSSLQNLTEQQTARQTGIRELLKEQEDNADFVLNTYAGFDKDQIGEMTRYQKSRFFQLAKLIQEELEYEDSDAAFKAVADTMKKSGKKASALLREYTKDGDKFVEKYEL